MKPFPSTSSKNNPSFVGVFYNDTFFSFSIEERSWINRNLTRQSILLINHVDIKYISKGDQRFSKLYQNLGLFLVNILLVYVIRHYINLFARQYGNLYSNI